MDQEQLLRDAEAFARAELSHDSSGHDWWHIDRVTRLTRRIAREEGADVFLCTLAALLHDIADYKIAGFEAAGQRRGRQWLPAPSASPDTPAPANEDNTTPPY